MQGTAAGSFRALTAIAHVEPVLAEADGSALWTAGEHGQIYRIDVADGSVEEVCNVGTWVLGLCFDGAGRLYGCAIEQGTVLRIDPRTGSHEVYCDGAGGAPLRTSNWPAFLPDGRLVVTASGSERLADVDGAIAVVPRGGGHGALLDIEPLHFPNTIAVGDDDVLWVAESFSGTVARIDAAGVTRPIQLPGTVPDGLALDLDGGMIVTSFQPNQVLRVPLGGGPPEVLLDDWTGQELLTPTACAFVGDGSRQVAVSSLCGWQLYLIDVPWRGAPLHRPDVP